MDLITELNSPFLNYSALVFLGIPNLAMGRQIAHILYIRYELQAAGSSHLANNDRTEDTLAGVVMSGSESFSLPSLSIMNIKLNILDINDYFYIGKSSGMLLEWLMGKTWVNRSVILWFRPYLLGEKMIAFTE